MTRRSKVLLAAAAAFLLIVLIGLRLNRTKDPVHAGRPVSAWFADLCSGVFGGTPKAKAFEPAYTEFTRMGPEAIPYLTSQLRYDRLGIRQKVIDRLRQYPATKRFGRRLIGPLERRCYAAVALRQMGPKAEAAIPALLESWAHDGPEVKLNVATALESILHGTFT